MGLVRLFRAPDKLTSLVRNAIRKHNRMTAKQVQHPDAHRPLHASRQQNAPNTASSWLQNWNQSSLSD
jgi:hypothetical protein